MIDEASAYNAEQIDDTAPIPLHNDNIDHIFTDDITWKNIFQDARYSQRQQRFCMSMHST